MNTPIRGALGDAMTLLKTGDVAAATSSIQRALGKPDFLPSARPARAPFEASLLSQGPRGLGNVLERLKSLKDAHLQFGDENEGLSDPLADVSDENFQSRNYRGSGGHLAYKVYVPADQDRELALVLMLHGCTQNPDDFARGTRMNRLADKFGLVVAYPHQPRSANAQGCWNWFDPRHQKRSSGEPAMLAGLAQELAAEFGIDPKRAFAAGLSAGGAMADILASTHPDVFAAVGVHSGLPHGAASDVMSAFAAMKGQAKSAAVHHDAGTARRIIFHGAADSTVHTSNGDEVLHRAQTSHKNSVSVSSDSSSNGRKVSRTIVDSNTGAALAEHWLIHGAGHAWSGGDRLGSFTDSTGPDASREMIRFFLA